MNFQNLSGTNKFKERFKENLVYSFEQIEIEKEKPENWSKERRYIEKKKAELINFYGARCNNIQCRRRYNLGFKPLEFAHITPTKLSGRNGRGKRNRILDVNKNRKKYMLLCPECHDLFDSGKL